MEISMKWKKGSVYTKLDVEVVHRELQKLRDKHGALTPEIIVSAARPKRSPLHKAFEWDDTVAAERYRLSQAQGLIRAVAFVPDDGTDREPIRAWASLPARNEYDETLSVMARHQDREYLLAQAKKEFESFRRRYRELQELADVFAAYDEAVA